MSHNEQPDCIIHHDFDADSTFWATATCNGRFNRTIFCTEENKIRATMHTAHVITIMKINRWRGDAFIAKLITNSGRKNQKYYL